MTLSDLTAYASQKYNIPEEHKWDSFSGFSVLTDPATGKWAALLMRQWDETSGTMIERCDIKCGQRVLYTTDAPCLYPPFRMRGANWVGVQMGDRVDENLIFRLLDDALSHPEKEISRGAEIHRGAEIFRGAEVFGSTPIPKKPSENRSYEIVLEKKPFVNRSHEIILEKLGSLPDRFRTTFKIPDRAIPDRIREVMRLFQFGDNSPRLKWKNFMAQGRYMEDYTDDCPWTGGIFTQFGATVTYHDLNARQLRGYFTWRTQVREGHFVPADPAFVQIYFSELINGIGASSAEDSLEKMAAFTQRYTAVCQKEDAHGRLPEGSVRLQKDLRRWMLEYAVLENISSEKACEYADPELMQRDRALAALRNPEAYTDKEIFEALLFFAGKKLSGSNLLKKKEEEAVHLFSEVWKKAVHAPMESGQDLFSECFGRWKNYPWRPLSGLVSWQERGADDTEYVLNESRVYTCRNGLWEVRRYNHLQFRSTWLFALLRESDRQFRLYLKSGGKLKAKPEEAWAAPFAEAVIKAEEEARRKAELERLEAERPKITIDLSALGQIRRDAGITRDSLLTEEDLRESEAAAAAEHLYTEDEAPENTAEHSALNAAQTAFCNPTEPQHITPGKTNKPEDSSASSPLEEPYRQIMLALLRDEPIAPLLQQYQLMPSLVTDAINDALYDEIGDIVLETDGDEPVLIEDYREDLLQIFHI